MYFDLTPPHHGGDLQEQQQQSGQHPWLDLSSACNREPWPVPAPDPRCWYELPSPERLFNAAQEYYGQRPIAVGAGTQQLIEILPPLLASQDIGKRVMVPSMGYQEHAFCWQKWGYQLHQYQYPESLLHNDWDVAVIINPNNPGGLLLGQDFRQPLFQYLQNAYQQGEQRWLIIDEAFIDVYPQHSWLTQPLPANCILLRSVGKFFGLPGARIGFAFGDPSLQQPLRVLTGPWPIATPAIEIVSAALLDREWQARAYESLRVRNQRFQREIAPLVCSLLDAPTCQHTPLFYSWHTTPAKAKWLTAALREQGIHIRLGSDWVRISLPADAEFSHLQTALSAV
ncbi:aminotransferase class I/II-fold pyridoxal phosphate-dependent enzyme [Parathalassolituus penaei]|uniref:Aminotransferase n=1 Tax=Parathalassolituus penaei TaxID=2997323 RepID=A0A9X3EDU3_9GAMM|nr:aminotransferase class I/II-fold pyridoxal phosphate-dependent enzyme [Parathalassolituus penaei]MCY0965366.1 aminotransferase class I/II-fold pyridoxal phosphate-dependent enzyme [Parathalassolituus penaei]